MLQDTLGLDVVFLVIALIAGLFGFLGVASYSWAGAQILFFVFLVLGVLAFVGGLFARRWNACQEKAHRPKVPERLQGKTAIWPSARKEGAISHHSSSPSPTDLECDEQAFPICQVARGYKGAHSCTYHHERGTLAQPVSTGPTTATQTAVASGDKDHNAQLLSVGEIRLCAYRKWESAGRPPRDSIRFWLEAEQELVSGM